MVTPARMVAPEPTRAPCPNDGGTSFTADCGTAKARRDLNALLYADGIHDSLYRSAGRSLTTPTHPSSSVANPPPFVTAGENNLAHA